ncbi:hypothetical protein V1264_001558 [Littorina saxatilis]|uniref:G-protein coupled receptors family 1 profile domain-containing protein n=2 Tax=Littorina saxatilis TaxID=31220 RepID=A0AAN9C1V6_9CAEN
MGDSQNPLPVTLEVVVVALAPQLSFNTSGNATTTPFSLHSLGNQGSYGQSPDGVFSIEDYSGDVDLGLNGDFPGHHHHNNGDVSELAEVGSMVSVSYIALFSTLFCIVGLVGMAGNVLVVYIVLNDKKMRKSVTNLLILNLAVADSLLMVFGVPEIVQFMLDRGWLLGGVACKVNRSVLVAALYASVLTLVSVCVER